MRIASPELVREFLRLAAVTGACVAVGGGLYWANRPDVAHATEPLWETDRCQAVLVALGNDVAIPEIAHKVEAHDMTPLDAQCLLNSGVPDEVWVAAMRSVSRTHPRYQDVMWVRTP